VGRALRIGLYSPYFGTTIGGGERYLTLTAITLRDAFPEHQIEILSPVAADPDLYKARLNVDLSKIRLESTNRRVTPAHRFLNSLAPLRGLRNRVIGAQAGRLSNRYDLFLAMIYAIPVRSFARSSVMLCQFPYANPGPELLNYERIICQSQYVRRWVREYWNRDSTVVSPPVDVPATATNWDCKGQLVVSVGRFFEGGHSKRQDVMVDAFKRMCNAGVDGWELHLAGSVQPQHREYYRSVAASAQGYPVGLHPDAPHEEVEGLYERSSIYWHAAGYGLHDDPSTAEHFGMTTVEAMAHSSVPVVFDRGGQGEVVQDGVTGFKWSSIEGLMERTGELISDENLRRRLGAAARAQARTFDTSRFRSDMLAVLEPLVRRLEPGR
jgi:glycosyltransferase involved in cell wall biosynthesis